LTNATQSVAELKLTGSDLREGDGFVRCVGKYLDVTEDLWTIPLHVERTPGGKIESFECGVAGFTLERHSFVAS